MFFFILFMQQMMQRFGREIEKKGCFNTTNTEVISEIKKYNKKKNYNINITVSTCLNLALLRWACRKCISN